MTTTGPSTAPWSARPVFISSTFKDLHAERDHLRNVVFPELAERLRARRHHLEPIDLRLGVETGAAESEEAKELLVLKVCLDEIRRCRPFLIVLLGDRYGWVPPQERMAAAAREAGLETGVEDKSVTALEIEFGILREDPELRRRSFFYFREPLPYEEMPPELAAEYRDADPASARALAELKTRIEEDPELGPRVRRYRAGWDGRRVVDLDAWGRQVLEDLWGELDDETRAHAQQQALSWEAEERAALEEFVELRGRCFIGRTDTVQELLDLARSPVDEAAPWGLCLTGAPGSGKSALFAHLDATLRESPDLLVLSHAAGITAQSTQVDSMLRRWIQELADHLEIAIPIEADSSAEDVEQAFASLLSRASVDRRVVAMLDALNQFVPSPRARHLTWLPKLWPPNARLIATAIPGPESQAVAARVGAMSERLRPLAGEEAAEIAAAVGRRFHRTFHPEVLKAVLDKRLPDGESAAGNPLWLTLAMEELNLLDADDFARAERAYEGTPEQRLHGMVLDVARRLPADVEGLYGWLLDRSEKVHGAPWARAFAEVTALSRFGWREADLRNLVPAVARLLDPECAGDGWADLQLASLRRSFRAHLAPRGAQGQWDFFHLQMRAAVAQRRGDEPTPARNIHATIADHLEGLPAEDPLRQTELMVHLIGADDRPRAARHYGSSIGEAESAGATQALAAHILDGAARDPNPGLAWVVSLLDPKGLEDFHIREIAIRFNFDLSDVLTAAATLAARGELLESAKGAFSRLVEQDPGNAEWLGDLASAHCSVGVVLQEQGNLETALTEYLAYRDVMERLAKQDPGKAWWQHELSVSHDKVGDVRRRHGDVAGALEAFVASLGIAERLARQDPGNAEWQRDISVAHEKIGDVRIRQGALGRALDGYAASLAIRERLAERDRGNAEWQRDLSIGHIKVGDVRLGQGDLAGALEAYAASLAIFERLAEQDSDNALSQSDLSVSQNKVGAARLRQGDLAGALAAYAASLAIRERLVERDPGNARWQRNLSLSHANVGEVREAQGDLAGALAAHTASLAIRERLVEQDPGNAWWRSDLVLSHHKPANLHRQAGNTEQAQSCWARCREVLERMKGAGMHLDPSLAKLLEQLGGR